MSANGRVVVLGGTGFLGRHVCAALDERGVEVVSVARGAPADLPPWRFLALDLVTRPARELARELGETGAGVVVNAVGSIWGRRDDQMWEAAAVPTLRLLDALETLPVRPRLVHLGSVLEYGRMREGSSTTAVAETRPTSAYGRAKLAATRAVLDRFHTGELTGMVLRISNIAGPGSPDVSLLGQVAGSFYRPGAAPR